MGVFVTVSYFFYFIPFLPLSGFLENAVIKNQLRHAAFFYLNIFNIPSVSKLNLNVGGDSDSDFFDTSTIDKLDIVPQDLSDFYVKPIDYRLIGGEDTFINFFSSLELFQISFIALFILFLGIFFPKSGEFTRFLNRISSLYLVYLLYQLSFGVVFRPIIEKLYTPKMEAMYALETEHTLDVSH